MSLGEQVEDQRKTPARTGGQDRDYTGPTPCETDPAPFDYVIDHDKGVLVTVMCFSNSARSSRTGRPHSWSWYATYSGSSPHHQQRSTGWLSSARSRRDRTS